MKLPMHSPQAISSDRNGDCRRRLESNGMDMPPLNPRGGRSNGHLKRVLTALASAISLTLAGYAQRADVPLPNAPRPTAVLSNSAAPSYLPNAGEALAMTRPDGLPSDAAAMDSSTVGDVSLYTVVDLALRNSRAVHVAEADQQRTRAIWMETRDIYIPNFSGRFRPRIFVRLSARQSDAIQCPVAVSRIQLLATGLRPLCTRSGKGRDTQPERCAAAGDSRHLTKLH